jgi:chaperonin GroES
MTILNNSGINVTEFKVLVLPKAVDEKSAGGIIIPTMKQDQDKFATTEGVIVDVSHLAFGYVSEDEWQGKKPKAGQRALYAKYAGLRVEGKDGKEYLIVNDKDIIATFED